MSSLKQGKGEGRREEGKWRQGTILERTRANNGWSRHGEWETWSVGIKATAVVDTLEGCLQGARHKAQGTQRLMLVFFCFFSFFSSPGQGSLVILDFNAPGRRL